MIGTTPPTRADLAHMGACKAGPCVACLVGVSLGIIRAEDAMRGGWDARGHPLPAVEYNHAKSGNLRRGHRAGYALCLWHHHGSQQLHALGLARAVAFARWGPSLFDQARAFHATFGSDDELIAVQAWVLEHSRDAHAALLA